MNEVSLKPVIEELENLFSKFNARFFADKLEKPVITVSPDHTRGAYGWCTGWKAWKAGEDEGHYGAAPVTDAPPPVKKISVKEAARCMGKSDQFVRIGLQRGLLPFGNAVPGTGNNWNYYIMEPP